MAKHRKTHKWALRKRAARSVSVIALTSALITGPIAVLNTEAVPALASTMSTTAPLRVAGPAMAHLPGGSGTGKIQTLDQRVVAFAKRFIGVPYVWGGTTPSGFDCSGLTQYVYDHFRKYIPRTADDQFHHFRMIPRRLAHPGDLVFFHDSDDPYSYVYHVGILTGGTNMLVAPTTGYNVQVQPYTWGGDTVTFGTIS